MAWNGGDRFQVVRKTDWISSPFCYFAILLCLPVCVSWRVSWGKVSSLAEPSHRRLTSAFVAADVRIVGLISCDVVCLTDKGQPTEICCCLMKGAPTPHTCCWPYERGTYPTYLFLAWWKGHIPHLFVSGLMKGTPTPHTCCWPDERGTYLTYMLLALMGQIGLHAHLFCSCVSECPLSYA